jgi:hypothetical protein
MFKTPRNEIKKSVVGTVLLITSYSAASDDRLVIGAGAFGVFDDAQIVALKLAYEFKTLDDYWLIRPHINVLATDNGAYFISVGAIKEFYLNETWRWGISFSAGGFHEDSKKEENDLDYDVEFYSTLSLTYQIEKSQALRAELGHISNAGFGSRNPGSESLLVSYVKHF